MLSRDLQQYCQAHIEAYVRQARARQAFLLDQDGHIYAHHGREQHVDIYSIAALLASLTAASSGIAQLLETPHFREAYYEGAETSLFSIRMGSGHILGTLFNKRETTLGLVRLRARHVTDQLHVRLREAVKDTFDFQGIAEQDIDDLLRAL